MQSPARYHSIQHGKNSPKSETHSCSNRGKPSSIFHGSQYPESSVVSDHQSLNSSITHYRNVHESSQHTEDIIISTIASVPDNGHGNSLSLGLLDISKQLRNINYCTLAWQNLSYTIRGANKLCFRKSKKTYSMELPMKALTEKSSRCILRGITGRSAPGELTAIIGPSGAGKTTLLDLLANRIDPSTGNIEGVIEVNGQAREEKSYRIVTSYVSPNMSFYGSFTVLETLRIAAALSLPTHIPKLAREIRVQEVIDSMGLRNCSGTQVGDLFHKGISNGQRKRLSIAVELLSNPSILLLDEPTSGLDSSSAFNVVQHLSNLCKDGKTVVVTIHQPSSSIYEFLTNLMILSSGEMVYFGSGANAINHFTSIGYQCPTYSNPAEYFVQLVNKDFVDDLHIEPFVDKWRTSNDALRLHSTIIHDRENGAYGIDPDLVRAWHPSPYLQFRVLCYRNYINTIRNPAVVWIRVLMYLLLCLMVGTMYLSSNRRINEEQIVPLLFYVQAFLVFMSIAAIPSFIEGRAVFVRERTNHSINLISYVAANFVASIPGIVIITLLASTIVVHFASIHTFKSFFINLFLSLVTAESFMHVLGAAVPHYIIGIALGAGVFGMFMLCEGFMVPRDAIPLYWRWGYYAAFHTYSFESFMYSHFSVVDTDVSWKILAQYGMEDVQVGQNMAILAVYALGLQIIFTCLLYFKYHRRS
ncbi:unnamed protein product [Albugo candida]|uniref:ABC transporter domain-containing protein n=1 Tax=Albugo candida TaxID=65357 RepID=A0A024GRA0_9STRA|nr:unnamed protein product [Albugo candida]|eukprot:CCI49083.1 unnamed protein product [Albugo candida]